MSIEIRDFTTGILVAEDDYSINQFCFVKASVNADFTALLVDEAGDVSIGVLQNEPTEGQPCEIMHLGVTKVRAGDAVTRGDLITPDADGKGIPVTKARTDTSGSGSATDPLLGGHVAGIALETAADGNLFSMLLLPMGAVPTTLA